MPKSYIYSDYPNIHTTIHHERARTLRKNLTDTERKLWFFLRKKQLSSFKFRRQVPMRRYIIDFVCLEVKVIVELDGGQHGESHHIIYDQRRTEWLEEQGYQVLRFWNNGAPQAHKEVTKELSWIV